jgi:hypothetical protein
MWQAALAVLVAMFAAVVEHERCRPARARHAGLWPVQSPVTGMAGVVFVLAWSAALQFHAFGDMALLCWAGTVAVVGLREGGWAGWVLGLLLSTLLAVASAPADHGLFGWLPEFGLGTLSPAHAHQQHAQWVQALRQSSALGPTTAAVLSSQAATDHELSPSLWWAVRAMQAVGHWPLAAVLAVLAVCSMVRSLGSHGGAFVGE